MVNISTYYPCEKLKNYIRAFWTLETNFGVHTERVISHLEPQFIFHFKDPFIENTGNGKLFRQPEALVSGVSTKPKLITASASSSIIGVVFFPHTLRYFLPAPVNEFTDSTIKLADIAKQYMDIEHQLRELLDNSLRIKLIEDVFIRMLSRLRSDCVSADNYFLEIYTRSSSSLSDIQTSCGFSERQLQRLFQNYVGISAKKFADINRIDNAISYIKNKKDLIDVAYLSGFYDQAHFINSFKTHTGLTPGDFRNIYQESC